MSKYKTPKPYLGYTTLPDVKTTERMKVDGKMRNLRVPVAKSADFEKLHAFADESTALLEKRNADPILSNITVPHTPSKSEYSFTSKALSNYQPWENDPRLETLGQTIDDNNSKLQRREGLVKKAEKRIREHRKNLFELNLKYPNTDIAKLLSPKIQEKLDKDISVYQQYYDDYSTLYTETTGIVDEYNSILGKEKERRTAWKSTVMPIEELLDFYDSYVGEGSSNKRLLNDPIATPEQKERARAEIDLYTSQVDDSLYLFTQSEDFKKLNDLTAHESGELKQEIVEIAKNNGFEEGWIKGTLEVSITDEQAKIYKYLKKLDKENLTNSAEGYVKYMLPYWDGKIVQKMSEALSETPPVLKQLATSYASLTEGIDNAGEKTLAIITGETKDPSVTERAKDIAVANSSLPEKILYGAVESVGNMLPSIGVGKLVGGAANILAAKKGADAVSAANTAAKIGKAASRISFGLSAAGSGYSEKISEGWSKDKARAYGTIVGISEVTLENVLGGITAVGGGKISAKAASKINAIRRTTPRIAAKLAVTGLSEATEEGLQTLLEPLYSGIINNEKYTAPSAEEVLISAASGFFLGDVMEFGTTVSADRNQALDTDIVNEYIEKGKKAEPGTVSRIMSDKISGILAENPDAKFSARDIGIIARMSKGDAKLKKNSTGTTSETSDTKVQGSDIANLFTPAEEVAPNVAKSSPAEAPAVPVANAEGVATTLPETNAESVTPSDPNVNLSTDAVTANTQTVKKFNYETPAVSRDGIEIKPESDPEIQKRLEGVTDDIERSGILSGASDDTISQVKQLSKAFKTKILFEVAPKITDEKGNVYTKNGRYNKKERTIYINMASDVMPIEQLVSHEFVHSIENTELYSKLKKYAQKFYKKTTGKGSFEKEAAKIFKEYQDSGEAENYRWHDAEAEVVANYVADKLLNSTENIEEFVKENRSLAEKLKAIIDKVLSVIGTRETKDAAKLRQKLYKASKLLESAIRNRDIQANTKTNIENDILTNLSELRNEINEGKITEEEYETRLEQLDKEAASQGVDLNELMKSKGDKHSITKESASKNKQSKEVPEKQNSDRVNNEATDKISLVTTEEERASILRKKTVIAPIYEGQTDGAIFAEKTRLESKKIGLVKQAIEKIAEEFAPLGEKINIEDADVTIVLSKSNLKESISKKVSPVQLAKLLPVLKESLSNSIAIERHANRYYFDTDTIYFDNLLGGYIDGVAFVPVRYGLKYSKNEKTTLYVVVDQNKIPKSLMEQNKKTEVVKTTGSQNKAKPSASRSVTYSISQIVPFVNSKDLLRYIPEGMLSDEQKDIKWQGIAETILKTNNKNDEHYFDYISEGKQQAARTMVIEAAKANGYTYEAWHGTRHTFNEFSKPARGSNTRTEVSKGWFFAADKDTANSYYPYGVIEALQGKEQAEKLKIKGNLYHLFLKMENPLIVDVADYDYEAHREKADAWMEFVEQAERNGNDGIILYNALDNQLKTKARESTVYMFRDSNQAKSAETIVKDDNDNIIPISQRFDSSKDDIRYSITKTKKATEKKIDEGIEARPVADRLPREGIRKLREIEKGVRNKIGDIYKLRYARVNELQPAVRKITEQYLANGEITDTDVDELLKFIETTFGNVSNKQDRNQVKYVLNEMIKGDLKYVKKAFDTIDKKVNSEPEWVKRTREQRAKDFANKSMREFRNWAVDTFSLSKEEKPKLEELLTNLINSVTDGQISDKTFNSLFDYLYNSGIVKNSEKKNQYPTVYSYLKKNKFTVSDDVKNNIPDYDTYKDFREDSQGHISLGNDGISITEAYEFLNSIAPELFPDDIEGEGYQAARILEVAQDLKPAKEWAFQDATDEEKRQIRKEYEENINNFVRNATVAVNYARGSATVEQESEIESSDVDVEKLVDIMEQMKTERNKANAARGKVILTEQEENIVRDLLNGSRPIEDIPDSYNKKDIIAVYEASKEYERLRAIVQKEKAMIRQKRYDRARKYLADGDVLSGFRDRRVALMYMLNPMERNLRYIGKRSQLSEDLIDAYIAPIKRANRMSILYKNSIVRKVEKLDISRKVKSGNTHSEAFAVQFVGEAESNIKYLKKLNDKRATKDGYNLDEWESMLDNFWLENTKIDRQKIHDAVDTFHEIYDELFKRMNEARVRNGYEPISYRRDYFPHFNPKASNDILAMFGKTLGLNIEFAGLPADINGLTQNFRPGIRYFANAEQRLGYETVFDAVEGLHRYLDGAMDVIYQTDNICNLRALSQQIRYQASDEGMKQREDEIRARTDLDETEIKAVLDAVHKEGKYTLSGFVNDLEEYTNLLAGKKSKWDRGVEALLGRNIYQFMKSVTGKIAANMIAWNVASWLTNFIPLVQGATGLETKYMLYGMGTGLVGLIKNDGFEAKSDFLTTRRGSDDLLKMYELTKVHSTKLGNAVSKSIIGKAGKAVSNALDKSAEIGMKPMEWIDMFVAHTLVRGRYQQNLSKGFDETTAMQEADKWAAGVMADRSKGGLPTIFGASNPLIKLVTQFQVETANQIGYFYSDVMNKEFRESTARAITAAILKYLIGAWIYNELYELLIGRRPALDPANIVNEAIGDFTGKKFKGINEIDEIIVSLAKGDVDIMSDVEKLPLNKATSELTANVLEEVPFVGGLIGGGRLPISSSLPDLTGLWDTVTSDAPPEKKKEKWQKELGTLATYYVLPGGGGQIAKTVKGISATNKGGKYSLDSKGREILQYPITPSPWTYIQSGIFGTTATEGGKAWVESGFDSLNWEQTKAYKAMVNEGLSQDKAFDVIDGISRAGDKKVDKVAYLNKADVSQNYKRAAYKEMFLPDSKKVILSALNDIGDYEDVVIDFMLEHPEATSKKEIMAIWGDFNSNGHLITNDKTLTPREKAAIIQVVADAKENPYWTKLKESVYYVVHPEEKIEDEERERENQKKKRR